MDIESSSQNEFTKSVVGLFANKYPEVKESDLKALLSESYKYKKHISDLLENIDFAMEAILHNHSKKQGGMDEELTLAQMASQTLKKLQQEQFSKINLYTAQASENAEPNQAMQTPQTREIERSKHTQAKIVIHSESYELKGKVLKSFNSALNFTGSRRDEFLNFKTILPNKSESARNFLYHKAADFRSAFIQGYERMEEKTKTYLKEQRISQNLIRLDSNTKNLNEKVLILVRLTLDTENDFNIDRITGEILDPKGSTLVVYLNFNKCETEFQLFPNMYAAVVVDGQFGETSALTVHTLIEIDSELDKHDETEAPARQVKKHSSILVFKGPYNLEGTAYFGGMDMIRHHLVTESPNLVVLMGPFVPEEQVSSSTTYKLTEIKSIATYESIRNTNLNRFRKIIMDSGISNCEVAILPDQSEADNFHPTPLPCFKFSPLSGRGISVSDVPVHSLDSPSMISLDGTGVTVAFSSQDFIRHIMTGNPVKSSGKKFLQTVKSVISQKSLHPAFPLSYPYDVTNAAQLYFDTNPDVWITSSSIIGFVHSVRGTVTANCKTVFNGEDFGNFVRILIDTGSNASSAKDKVRVDLMNF